MSRLVAGVLGGLALLAGSGFAWNAFAKSKRKRVGAALPTVKLGSKGDAVRALQQGLWLAGYRSTIDGDFGPKTDTLLKQWQAENGMPLDGVAGPAVWAQLAPAVPDNPTLQQRVATARSWLGKKTKYVLGGSKPDATDCSGFLAQVIGVPRDKVGRVPSSIHTDAIVRDATKTQAMFRVIARPVPGCLVVYPDRPGEEGHAGIVSQVYPLRGVDCGSSNYRKSGNTDAVAERDFGYFLAQGAIFCVLTTDPQPYEV